VPVAFAMLVGSLAGCSTKLDHHGAPPWVVCNTTLVKSPAGPVIVDATSPTNVLRVENTTLGSFIALLTSRDCHHGATLAIAPSGAGR
jgi:hypothetical protein